jgi:hypothetical protein
LPECLDDFIDESNAVRVIDLFVDALDLVELSRRQLVGRRIIPSSEAVYLQATIGSVLFGRDTAQKRNLLSGSKASVGVIQ